MTANKSSANESICYSPSSPSPLRTQLFVEDVTLTHLSLISVHWKYFMELICFITDPPSSTSTIPPTLSLILNLICLRLLFITPVAHFLNAHSLTQRYVESTAHFVHDTLNYHLNYVNPYFHNSNSALLKCAH